MTLFTSLVILCGFVALQCDAQGAGARIPEVGRSNESSDESGMRPFRPNQADNMQEQYAIVRLCTSMPKMYDDIVTMYLSNDKVVNPKDDIQIRVNDFKEQSAHLSKYINDYSQSLNVPAETYPVGKELTSKNDALTQAMEKLSTSLTSQQQFDTAGRIALVQTEMKPALMDFQVACLAETEDIVSNMLADLRDNSSNTD